jgi:uncharacterized protein (TIGR02246 family)
VDESLVGGKNMRRILFGCALALVLPLPAAAGPKEDALQVLQRFKAAFDAADMQTVVSLFAPDALFLPTTNPKLLTTTKEVDNYFQPFKLLAPLSMKIDSSSSIVLSDEAVLFTGMDTFGLTRDGKEVEVPARFTILVTKGDQGWRITHFHSSARPG